MTKLPELIQSKSTRESKEDSCEHTAGLTILTLRDWFAGQALVGVFTVDTRVVTPEDADRLAANCYTLAEAMVRRSLQG